MSITVSFEDRFWHRVCSVSDYPTLITFASECVTCAHHELYDYWDLSEYEGTIKFDDCGGKGEVIVPLDICEKFDTDRAKEVMDTLRDILDVDGIQWKDKSVVSDIDGTTFALYRTHITYHGKLYSVILGMGTYGCEEYKLELMADNVNGGEPVGYLTVTDVIDIMKNGYKEN